MEFRRKRQMRATLFGLVGSAAFGALLAAGGLDLTRVPAGAQARTAAAEAAPQYVGNAACAECHEREMVEHEGSRHDMTLRLADTKQLGDQAPAEGPIPGTAYVISRKGGKFSFGSRKEPEKTTEVQLVYGSGKTGVTYATLQPQNQEVEFRMSYIPSTRKWYITPGQESMADIEPGLVHGAKVTRACIGCHANGVPEDIQTITPKMFGVGCESCHGPGSAHIAAARIRGNTDLKIEKMSTWSARKLNELCGKCHRSMDSVSLIGRDASASQRFQVYGLEMSPCFRKSGEKISCATCHDSHTNVTHDQKSYERVCITCHQSPNAPIVPDPRVPADAIRGKRPCPVNAKEKCVSCHMPATQVFPGSKIPVKMADHMIWAYGKKKR